MNKYRIQEKLYLFLGLFFITTPIFAMEPMTAMLISAGVSALMGGVGAASAGAARRRAERRERSARARRQAAEANRQDIPDFQEDMLNPYANLQVATRGAEMQAEQADISLASSLDVLRATGASAGGATALARAAAQSKRGVSASIEQQEAKNAQLRAQGEMQAAQMRQKGQVYAFQAQEAREMTQLDREASLESSYNQQAAAYGAQSSAMAGQAVGSLATAGLGAYAGGMFDGKSNITSLPKAEAAAAAAAAATTPPPEAEIKVEDINIIEPLEEVDISQYNTKERFNKYLSKQGASTLAKNRAGGQAGHLDYLFNQNINIPRIY